MLRPIPSAMRPAATRNSWNGCRRRIATATSGSRRTNSRKMSAHVPETHVLSADNADMLAERKAGFVFKPRHGYASRGLLDSASVGHGRLRRLSRRGEGYVAQRRIAKAAVQVEVRACGPTCASGPTGAKSSSSPGARRGDRAGWVAHAAGRVVADLRLALRGGQRAVGQLIRRKAPRSQTCSISFLGGQRRGRVRYADPSRNRVSVLRAIGRDPIRDRCAGAASRKIESSNYQLSRRRQRAAVPSPAWRPFSGRASHRDARA